jgi:hypothetical protein
MKLIHSILVAAATLMAAPAHAAVPAWSANATSCVPDPASIETNSFTTTGAKVAHRANNVDPIKLSCAISDPSSFSGSFWNLVVTYRDSTGVGTSASVKAQVVRISRVTGNAATVATFDSNSSSAVGIAKGSSAFINAFNFDTSYYFVQIVLDRTLTTEIVEVYGVAIEPQEI